MSDAPSFMPKQCVILVGGMGNRLGEAVRDVPKPMLDVGGWPFVVYLIHRFAAYGLTRFLLLAGYKAKVVKDYFAQKECPIPECASVMVLPEELPLGTGGAVKAAAGELDDSFLLANGDTLCTCDIHELCQHFCHVDTLARIALRRVPDTGRYGRASTEGSRIDSFGKKEMGDKGGLINAGLYFIDKAILDFIPRGNVSLEQAVFPVLASKKRLEWFDTGTSYFIDIGIPGDLKRAREEIRTVCGGE